MTTGSVRTARRGAHDPNRSDVSSQLKRQSADCRSLGDAVGTGSGAHIEVEHVSRVTSPTSVLL